MISLRLRFTKGLVQSLRYPAVLLVNFAPDNYRVHDRKDPGLAEIGLLDVDVILKQALDLAAAVMKRRRHAGGI